MDEIAEMEERLELALELETLFNHAYESNGESGLQIMNSGGRVQRLPIPYGGGTMAGSNIPCVSLAERKPLCFPNA